jgi:hypothetical protein
MKQTHTPAQRAAEALSVADRAVARLTEKRDLLAQRHEAVTADLEAAKKRRGYLAQNPDLASGQQPETAPPEGFETA